MPQRSSFRYFRTSPGVIGFAVMLYIRLPLFLWNVEDLPHERGIGISHRSGPPHNLSRIDCDVVSVSHARLAIVRHKDLQRFRNANPRIAAVFWRTSHVVGSVYREWVLNIRDRSALLHPAHLLRE